MQLECIKEFSLTNGYNVLTLEKGSIWKVIDLSKIEALIENEKYWVEITIENYKNNFKELK